MAYETTTTSDKFGRNYELNVEVPTGQRDSSNNEVLQTLTINLPFTIEFDITRNTLTSANVCQIRVYNLSKLNRNKIRYNAYDSGNFRAISLRAGYGTNLATIFSGNISQAWSVREGVNFITQIECYDGGFAFVNGRVEVSFPAGTAMRDVIRTIMGYLPNVTIGTVGDFPGTLQRANTYVGNTVQILNELTGGAFFIDKGVANALLTNEYIANNNDSTILINSRTGLLETPVLEQTTGRFTMLFEPSLDVGRQVQIDSITNSDFNGKYIITAVKHRGLISGVVAGSATTTGEFFYSKQPVPVQ